MSEFKHTDGMLALLSELYQINERILTGDICSPKTAIASDRMKKLLNHYAEAISEDGASNIHLQVYVAAGGRVGLTYSYNLDGMTIEGSQTPRRV